jgi:hypothetical protein
MYDEFLQKIDKLYEDDRKKLRTGTILYGKQVNTYKTLTGLLEAVYEEGERLVFNNEYLDFE